MKKVALAALLSSMVCGSALAVDTTPAKANMVFEGSVTSAVPGSNLKITGIGGGPLLNGKLTVEQNGKFTTEKPVDFEIRDANATDSPIFKGAYLRYTAVNVVANGTSVIYPSQEEDSRSKPTLELGSGQKLTENDAKGVQITEGTDALHIASISKITGFNGGDVSATVAVMVSSTSFDTPAPTTPTPDTSGGAGGTGSPNA